MGLYKKNQTQWQDGQGLSSYGLDGIETGSDESPSRIKDSQTKIVSTAPLTAFDSLQSDFDAPGLLLGFNGIDITEQQAIIGFNRVPPDHNGAAGMNHVVSVLNHVMQIYDKQGNLISTQTLDSIFGVVNQVNVLPVDPNIMYDPYADRFVYVSFEIAGTGSNPVNPADDQSFLNIAVSKTGNPMDGWHVASIDAKTVIGGNNTWIDFPGIAVDDDAIYISGNMFQFDGGSSFAGNRLWIVEKGESAGGVYDGGAISFSVHDPVNSATDLSGLGVSNGTLMPARIEGGGPGDSGIYLLTQGGLSNGAQELLQVIHVEDPLSSPTFTAQSVSLGDISDESLQFLPQAPQPGGPQPISVVGPRILSGASIFRDGHLYTAFSVAPKTGPNAGETTVHWVELDATNPASINVVQQGDIGGEDIAPGTFTFDASLNVNKDGSILVNFSAAGPSVFAGAYFAMRAVGDPNGEIGPAQVLREGQDYYFRNRSGEGISPQTINRWGDFSGVSIDPRDDTTFWFFNQFAIPRGSPNPAGQDGRWRVAVGSARPTIENFQFQATDDPESFYGGLGVDGLVITGLAASPTKLKLTLAGDASIRGGLRGDADSFVKAFFIEKITFMGGSSDDELITDDQLLGAGFNSGELTAFGGSGADSLSGVLLTASQNAIFFGEADADTLIGGAGADMLDGGGGDDILSGGRSGDLLRGRSEDDALNGGGGADTLEGGAGNDSLTGETGADELRGNDGADTLNGGGGADTLSGAEGADVLDGGAAADRLTGGTENDTLDGGNGNDVLLAGQNGDDLIFGGIGADSLNGGADNDTLDGGGGFDTASGGGGNDVINGEAGDDLLLGGDGLDTIHGGNGNDRISGAAGADSVTGGAGADVVKGNDGNDTVEGGNLNDTLNGGADNDVLDGGNDDDRLVGAAGDDSLLGGAGDDQLFGNLGMDTLAGGDGNDTLTGNAGNDQFNFALGDGADEITDFVAGAATDDVIVLSGFGALFDEFSEIQAAASDDGFGNAVIDFGGGDTITLTGVAVVDLNQDDFIFA